MFFQLQTAPHKQHRTRDPRLLTSPLDSEQGRVVDFKNTLIIMTSNVGSSVIEKGGGRIGFQLDLQTEEDSSYNRIKNLVNEELKQYFRCCLNLLTSSRCTCRLYGYSVSNNLSLRTVLHGAIMCCQPLLLPA